MFTIRPATGCAGLGLLPPVRGGVLRGRERALEVHRDHRVPLGLFHVGEHAVAQDAGVVDERVEPAERVDRALDHAARAGEVGDVLAVGDGFAAHRLDLLDDFHRGAERPAVAVHVAAEVVDDDLGALGGVGQRVLAADAPSRSGDDDDAAVADTHDLLVTSISELLAQLVLVELAVVVPGQRLDELDAAGTLVVRDAVAAPLDDLVAQRWRRLDARVRLDRGHHDLAPLVVGDADHTGVADGRDARAAPPRPRPDRCSRRR